ncbi:MAG: META domain-containing protein [bacterium]|nr:META domain-containing protein [bacterium]
MSKNLLPILLVLGAIAGLTACSQPESESKMKNVVTEPAQPDATLEDTLWRATSCTAKGAGEALRIAEGVDVNAVFAGGRVSGKAACNRFNGSYEIKGDGMTVGPVASTKMLCPGDGVMQAETAFLSALALVTNWEIRGGSLALKAADGSTVVELAHAGPAPAEETAEH